MALFLRHCLVGVLLQFLLITCVLGASLDQLIEQLNEEGAETNQNIGGKNNATENGL